MKHKVENIVVAAVVCVILVLAALAFYHYDLESARAIKENAHRSLDELSREQSIAMKGQVEGVMRLTRTLGAAVHEDMEEEKILSLLQAVQESGSFNGAGYVNAQGEELYFGEDCDHDHALSVSGKETQVAFTHQGDEHVFVFYTPVEGGGYVYLCCPPAHLRELLSIWGVLEGGFSFIAQGDGHILAGSDHSSFVDIMDNAFDFFQEVIFQEGSIQQVQQDMAQGGKGTLVYRYGNQYRYVAYAPMEINDWYLFNVADGNLVARQQQETDSRLWWLRVQMLAIFVVVLALAIWQRIRLQRKQDALVEELEDSRRLRDMAEELSYTILFEADPVTGEMRFNQAFERQLGHKPRVSNFDQILKDDCPLPLEEAQAWRRLVREMKRGLPKSHMSVQLQHVSGEPIWYRVSFETLYNQDKTAPVGIVGRMANIEWQEREQDRNLMGDGQDGLTGLMGHTAFMQRAASRVKEDGQGAVLMVDIDGFRTARDAQGRYQGDQLLVNMSEAMGAVFSGKDLLGRMGGDTFAVFMTGQVTPREAGQRCQLLCSAFKEKTGCTCSVGIALCSGDASLNELSRQADKALYRAKLAGKGRYEFYEAPREGQNAIPHQSGDINLILSRCATGLLTCEALPLGVDMVLEEIGKYYRADRACLLQKDNGRDRMRETYTWSVPGREVSEALILPLGPQSPFTQSLSTRHSFSFSASGPDSVKDEDLLKALKERQASSVYAVPAGKPGGEEGFVAIENPKEHVGNVTLLKQTAACLFSALNKYCK